MANILYVVQFFSVESEPGGQGQRHFKHAKALVEDGHQVTVITGGGTTMFLENKQIAGGRDCTDYYLQPGLRIIRIPTQPMTKRDVFSRAKCYLNFSIQALMAGLRLRLFEHRRFGFVLGSSPPLLVALVAYLLSLVNWGDFYMEVRDLWSQTMSANGFIKNQWAIRINRCIESWLYRKSRRIIVVSPAFSQEIEAQTPGVLHKISYIPNGADLEFYQEPMVWQGSYLRAKPEEYSLFHVTYAGVYSDYTHLETLLEAAAIVQDQLPNVRFNLVGGGYQFEKLQSLAKTLNLKNVQFWGALPKNRINKFLMEGDLSVINYRALGVFGQVLPNKLFDYLAAGKPIIAAAPKGEISRILKESRAGITVEPENVEAVVECIRWFYNHPDQGLKMGERGYQYVSRHFNRSVLIVNFLKLFPRVIPIGVGLKRDSVMAMDASAAAIHH